MALKSAHFKSDARLQRAAENNPPINRGESGQVVRIIQQALIDLGFPLPISTRRFGSPDGIYGQECITQVRAMQAKFHLSIDGSCGRQTMNKFDELLPAAGAPLPPLPASGFTHKLRLHLRSIDTPQIGEMTQLKVMQDVFAQFAIQVEMFSGQSVLLTPGETFTLNVVDGDRKWDQVSDEQRLLQGSGSQQGVGVNDITAYFATVLREKNGNSLQGCAGHAPNRPAVMIAASAVDKTTLAHEVCHVLLSSAFTPVHEADSKNLMCSAPVCTGNPATLTDAQLTKIRASRFLSKLN